MFAEGKSSIGELVPDEDAVDSLEGLSGNHVVERVQGALRRLSEREREVLERRMRGETLAEAGNAMTFSRERMRQIEAAAMTSMRKALRGMRDAAALMPNQRQTASLSRI